MDIVKEEKILIAASEAYYNEAEKSGVLKMTDGEFDTRKSAWEQAAGRRLKMGAKSNVSSVVTMTHGYADIMGTLDKAQSIEEFEEWCKKRKFPADMLFGVSFKYDGHSILMEYRNNKLHKAMTRGQDGVGKDLTGYFKAARDGAYCEIKIDGIEEVKNFAVAYEAVISWDDLALMNEEFGENYKNPRSSIGGIIKEDGVPMAKYLKLIPLKFRLENSDEITLDREDEIAMLERIGEAYPDLYDNMGLDHEVGEGMTFMWETVNGSRSDLPYMIDGLVIECMDESVRSKLGYSDDRPNFAIALKFPYMEKETEVMGVSWFTEGNSAIFTPVVHFKPLVINGNTYKQTSLANYGRFESMDLHIGDRLTFQLRGEVLGWCDKLETKGNVYPALKAPTHCTHCEELLQDDEVFLYCVNPECDLVKLGNLQQFIDKLRIKGVQRASIKKMYEASILIEVPDFFEIDYKRLAKLEGFGKASADKIKKSIEDRLSGGLKDYEILGTMNMPLISVDRAKIILKEVSLAEILDEDAKVWGPKVLQIFGIKEKIVRELKQGVARYHNTMKMMTFLTKVIVTTRSNAPAKDGGVTGQSYRVCITGALKKYKDRTAFIDALEAKGHKFVNGVTKKTDFLITNDEGTGTVKNQTAHTLGVPIITELQAIEKFGLNSRSGDKQELDELFD